MSCCGEIRTTHHSYDSWCEDNNGILLNQNLQALPINYTAGSTSPLNGNLVLVGGPTDGFGSILIPRQGLYTLRVRIRIQPRDVDTQIAIRIDNGSGILQTVAFLTIPEGQTETLAALDLPLPRGAVISFFLPQGVVIVPGQAAVINGVPIQAPATLIQLRYVGPIARLPAPTPAPPIIPPILL